MKREAFFLFLILMAVFLQYGFFNVWGVKPNWVLAVFAALVVFSQNFFVNAGFLSFGAFVLKTEAFFEMEIILFIAAGAALIFAANYFRRGSVIFVVAAAAVATLVFLPPGFYQYLTEAAMNIAIALAVFFVVKNFKINVLAKKK
ncbi:hypothetical protein A3A20_01160 [Candidatus Wolfebacteria bacterium RIFCSPLOWO2_01_FULL_45_19]|uniref:Uncharacterized protein n=1 Tax=Candidatus Wolfebacteria bacterium RIFCSPLOWO2_01_FULL_45_19 TaxID=1802557 RepID=A0A1F8DSD8_9BACT|nr:MAG: hypothetical protein A3A20_01160 [Candidatus Wolfebacteria bacterium RIFCSPLOWO2_01_FULL_45_19]